MNNRFFQSAVNHNRPSYREAGATHRPAALPSALNVTDSAKQTPDDDEKDVCQLSRLSRRIDREIVVVAEEQLRKTISIALLFLYFVVISI